MAWPEHHQGNHFPQERRRKKMSRWLSLSLCILVAANCLSSAQATPTSPFLCDAHGDDLSHGCSTSLSSSSPPSTNSGRRMGLLHGFWIPDHSIRALLSLPDNFHDGEDDVLVATLPKSGTTWLKAIVFALSHRSTGQESSRQPSPLLTSNPHELVPFLESVVREGRHINVSTVNSNKNIISTHLPYTLLPKSMRESNGKIIYLCRNLKDEFTSFWHYSNSLRTEDMDEIPLEKAFDNFCQGVIPFGPWWNHILGYWKASLDMPEKVLFLQYEDLKERPLEIIKRIAAFIGSPFEEGEDGEEAAKEIVRMCSFESLSNLEVNKRGRLPFGAENKVFFRKGEVGDWANLLSPEMGEQLDRIIEEKLGMTGLKL